MKNDDDPIAEAAVSTPKPVHIPIEQASPHPLVCHAVIDERGHVQWPHFTERQKQVAADTVRLIRVDGRRYFSLPPRVNADWFLPENPTPDDLRSIYGSTPDLQRWYLSIDLTSGARDALLVTSVTLNGLRAFFTCSTTSSWVRMPARTFTSWRDGDDFALAPVDRLVAEWRREWNVASRRAAGALADRSHDQKLERKNPRTERYWRAWNARVSSQIELIDLDLLLDPGADRDALKERRRRLAWDRWNISKRISDFREAGD
ncbi:MAG: hypothetical protein KJ659_04235 [Actinobacteria bacterium]|nr:hypothetical protein [Actinomycetota bacterium]MBU1609616.1 hypothetical protein [Actinomycetota bacterium]MBU2315451.1 hypothetical protein [Actinomycetota bacterium]MBU2384695.1 hypothetical protein [Actinomycetota bacterium]